MERTHGSYTKRYGPSKIFSDNRGVVQALHKGEVDCISAGHEDADLWVFGSGARWMSASIRTST